MPLADIKNKKNLKGLGRLLASKGNREDSLLAHISPSEAEILRSLGGTGTINPRTGLPQFYIVAKPSSEEPEVDLGNMGKAKGIIDTWTKDGRIFQQPDENGNLVSWSPGSPPPVRPYSTGEGDHLNRTDTEFSPPGKWDAAKYLKDNPDLQGDKWATANPLAHYNLFGKDEGRGRLPGGYDSANYNQASRLYLERNPDVLDTGMDPWEHYETVGRDEGRKWQGDEYSLVPKDFTLPNTEAYTSANAGLDAIKNGGFFAPKGDSGYKEPTETVGLSPGDTLWGNYDPGEWVEVDRYGWVKASNNSMLPPGSFLNVVTGKWIGPNDKKTPSNKGNPKLNTSSNSEFTNAMSVITPGLVNAAFTYGGLPFSSTGQKNKKPLGGLLDYLE